MRGASTIQSGEAWIGVVPKRWSVEPLGRWFRERKTTVSDADFAPLSVTMQGIVPQLEKVAKTDNNTNRKLVLKGDFAINSRSDRKGAAGVSGLDGSVSVITTVLQSRGLDPRFTHHLLRSRPFQEEFYRWGHGIVDDLWSTKWSDMKSIKIPVPPDPEQRAIADYLDRETAQIDAFIAKNVELITLLTERRLSAITFEITEAAGTKPWVALRHLTSVLDCKHVTAELAVGDDSYAVASVREVAGRWVTVEKARRTSADSFQSLGEGGRVLRAWDLLVCRNASVGKVSIVPPGIEPVVMGQDVSLIRTPDADADLARFLYYVLTSAVGVDGFEQASIGSTFKRINVDDIKSLRAPNVESRIARRIADQLDAITAQVDEAIETAERGVVLARERRAALITAAVTGKINVGVAA